MKKAMKKETRKRGEGQDEMMSANDGQTTVKQRSNKNNIADTRVHWNHGTGIMKRTKTK
jgi:hypothetical protein